MSDHTFHHVRSDMLGTGHLAERKNLHARRTEEHINHCNEGHATDQRAREVFLRIFHLGANQVEVLPTVVGPQGGRQSAKKRADQRGIDGRWPNRIGSARRVAGERKRQTNDNYHADYFDDSQKYLYSATETYAQIVHAGHGHQPENGERLRPGKYKIIGMNPVSESRDGNVQGKDRRSHRGNEKTEEAHHARGDGGGG